MQGSDRVAFYRGITVGAVAGVALCTAGLLLRRSGAATQPAATGLDEVESDSQQEPGSQHEGESSEHGAESTRKSTEHPPELHGGVPSDGFAWSVLWDFENVTPPLNTSGNRIVQRLRVLLGEFRGRVEPDPISRITVLCDVSSMQRCMQNELQASGVSVCHVPRRGRKEASDKALLVELGLVMRDHSPPYGICLVTGDADFAYGLAVARNLGYQTAVIAPAAQQSSPLLTNNAHKVWSFPRDVLTAATRSRPTATSTDVPSHVSSGAASDALTRQPAGISPASAKDLDPVLDKACEPELGCHPDGETAVDDTSGAAATELGDNVPEHRADVSVLRSELSEMKVESASIRRHLKLYRRLLANVESDICRIQGIIQPREPSMRTAVLQGAAEGDNGVPDTFTIHHAELERCTDDHQVEITKKIPPLQVCAPPSDASRRAVRSMTRSAIMLAVVTSMATVMYIQGSSEDLLRITGITLEFFFARLAPEMLTTFSSTYSRAKTVVFGSLADLGPQTQFAITVFFVRLLIFVGLLNALLKRAKQGLPPDQRLADTRAPLDTRCAHWRGEATNVAESLSGSVSEHACGDVPTVSESGSAPLSSGAIGPLEFLPRERRLRKRKPRSAISTLSNPGNL
jgi:hypothetical protein